MDAGRGVGTVLSRAPAGLAAPLVRVEVHLSAGLPAFVLVGLPEIVVRESKERVRSAILNAGFDFPAGRITINLSPADLPKEGGRFDLPIAMGILAASGQLVPEALQGREFYGELSLSGELRETTRLLPSLVAAAADARELIVPIANAREARLAANPRIRLGGHLAQVCRALNLSMALPDAWGDDAAVATALDPSTYAPDLAEVRGQSAGKRALEIAAAGEHGLLMVGPPGTGKTLLAQRLPGLLPPLSPSEALEVASLLSAAGQLSATAGHRPFRAPQHTASIAALIGSASRPGELSLAHHGILFLDELPEFSRNVLESLREPLESGTVVVSRLKRVCEYPARFLLIAAMNPCPCGYAGDPNGRCRCTPSIMARYRGRLSGPLIDRIDMHIELRSVRVEELLEGDGYTGGASQTIESSAAVARRVAVARALALERQGRLNGQLGVRELEAVCVLDRESRAIIASASRCLGLSARAYHRILKVARTCADLAAEPRIRAPHLSEAVRMRMLDRATC